MFPQPSCPLGQLCKNRKETVSVRFLHEDTERVALSSLSLALIIQRETFEVIKNPPLNVMMRPVSECHLGIRAVL